MPSRDFLCVNSLNQFSLLSIFHFTNPFIIVYKKLSGVLTCHHNSLHSLNDLSIVAVYFLYKVLFEGIFQSHVSDTHLEPLRQCFVVGRYQSLNMFYQSDVPKP